jgi:hypothetical protein
VELVPVPALSLTLSMGTSRIAQVVPKERRPGCTSFVFLFPEATPQVLPKCNHPA